MSEKPLWFSFKLVFLITSDATYNVLSPLECYREKKPQINANLKLGLAHLPPTEKPMKNLFIQQFLFSVSSVIFCDRIEKEDKACKCDMFYGLMEGNHKLFLQKYSLVSPVASSTGDSDSLKVLDFLGGKKGYFLYFWPTA